MVTSPLPRLITPPDAKNRSDQSSASVPSADFDRYANQHLGQSKGWVLREFRERPLERAVMSALGQKRTCAAQKGMSALHPKATTKADMGPMVMSALPPKADMCGALTYVCFGPIADIRPPLLDQAGGWLASKAKHVRFSSLEPHQPRSVSHSPELSTTRGIWEAVVKMI